ncbi:pentapeptide repeat-containing protein [Streptosporangium roseum]|uniref:pentapeptide repeat-containing protein n=1 Tax=Streptosporangium roseum TaxID=2001 RepID=UPI003321E15D
MNLDLTGATLIDFDLTSGHVTKAIFDKATFTETARFSEATFTETAEFNGATFTGYVEFDGATFIRDAWFNGAAVANPAEPHSWPDGWCVTVTPEGTGSLVREGADGVPAGED